MFRIIIISIIVLSSLSICFGQGIRLRKDCRIDTLNVALSFAPGTNDSLQDEMRFIFDSLVWNFNADYNKFVIVVDSNADNSSLHVDLSLVEFVNRRRNISFTAINLVFVAGTVILNSMTGYIIPFLLFPSTSVNMAVSLSPDLSASTSSLNSYASGNGFWLSQKDQEARLLYGFEGSIEEIFRKTHARYSKIRKKLEKRKRKKKSLTKSSLGEA